MNITTLNDLIEIVDDQGAIYVVDPYVFQSIQILSYGQAQWWMYIRWGHGTSEDCECVTVIRSTKDECVVAKDGMIKALHVAKMNRRMYG